MARNTPSLEIIRRVAERTQRRGGILNRYDEFWDRWEQLTLALEAVREIPSERADEKTELLGHFPVALVAAIENFFRYLVGDLIDAGEPFSTKARGLKDVRFDLDAVLAIGTSRITAGEFISHLLPMSSLEAIDNHVSTVLGSPLLGGLRTSDARLDSKMASFGSQADDVFAAIRSLFESRHRLCHELVHPKEVIKNSEMLLAAMYVLMFVHAADDLVRGSIKAARRARRQNGGAARAQRTRHRSRPRANKAPSDGG